MAIVKKISELTPKGSNLGTTDLLIVGVDNGTDYDLKSVTGAQLLGTVVSQTITDGVTTKAPSENIVFDSLALKVDKVTGSRLITSAESTLIGNTSGTNTGDQDLSGKVDKVVGKGLSTEDYTTVEKSKLAGLSGTNTGDQTLQTVTDKGSDTTNNMSTTSALYRSSFSPSTVKSATLIGGIYTSIDSDGKIQINTNGNYVGILKATNLASNVTLEIPNKTVGSYTIATTTDLTSKVDSNTAITGAAKTKITYDSKGLVTSGSDATTADIADSSNKRYVTDANLTTIGNTSGTNTGDQDLSTLLVKSNNLSDLTNTTTARTALGLGTLATQSGTFSGTSSGTNTGDQVISDATITTTDITTNNFTTAKHGFVPKGTNAGNFLKDDGTWATPSAGGLTYFTEAQNTTAPNATVPVDSLTAVSATTNADFAILPKGTGALISQISDGTTTGGNKRGARAVDFQRSRTGATQVASGADTVILSGINNRVTGTYSVIGGGSGNDSSGAYNFVFGRNGYATGDYVFEFGNNGGGTASGGFGFLSASTAGGATSFNGTATGVASFSKNGVATGLNSVAFSGTASGAYSFVVNTSNVADGKYSSAFGINSSTKGIASRISLGALQDISPYLQGSSQISTGVVTTQTTTNTAISLLVYNGTAIALPLQNNEAIRVKGSIIGKQTASVNVTCYDFDCVIVRGVGVATTVLKVNNMNLVFDDIICTVLPTLNADTTNGGLDIKSGGKVTTTIKWVARIDSTESILA